MRALRREAKPVLASPESASCRGLDTVEGPSGRISEFPRAAGAKARNRPRHGAPKPGEDDAFRLGSPVRANSRADAAGRDAPRRLGPRPFLPAQAAAAFCRRSLRLTLISNSPMPGNLIGMTSAGMSRVVILTFDPRMIVGGVISQV